MAGGSDSFGTFLSSSEVYQYPGGEAWRAMADLPSPSSNLHGASLAGIFYLVVGDDGHDDLDDILIYNIATGNFSLAGHLTNARAYHGVTAVPWQAVAHYWCNTTD